MQSHAVWLQSERASSAIGVANSARITRMAWARRIESTLAQAGARGNLEFNLVGPGANCLPGPFAVG
jgi:hypothetical protein